ncbi:PiggyBac transposable element-derived protein [Trichinella spiralis]|uniref:PiggyBac transposable element-derived protein n=1 Tax=Trichinella spiralis TaxID=6334 RepID=A0ABR3KBY8_TRISP
MRGILEMTKGLNERRISRCLIRYAFSEDLPIVARMPKDKNVLALSAMYNNTQVSDGKDSKPDIIVHYNNTKSSVDNLDQVTSAYSRQRLAAQ